MKGIQDGIIKLIENATRKDFSNTSTKIDYYATPAKQITLHNDFVKGLDQGIGLGQYQAKEL